MTATLAIPAFTDNYIWLTAPDSITPAITTAPSGTAVIIIDPGAAEPVINALKQHQLQPCAILVTHHHYDHIDGITTLCHHYNLPVYGPAGSTIPELSHPVQDNDDITLDNGMSFRVIATPGHTLDHLCYYQPGLLFSGDTLFAAGCGRLFEGSAPQMFHSLNRLASLPDNTRVCCTHEYTLANLKFAHAVEPENRDIIARLERVQRQRARNQITLPSTLAEERLSNPFLRCSERSVMAAAARFAQRPVDDPIDAFKIIRFWKDSWQG
jgi:hydroxyacylglutathione hydrolase